MSVSSFRWKRGLPQSRHVIPPLLALILALPCVGFDFAWDDFDFLAKAQQFSAADLAPNAQVLFYRPLSRQVYFSLLALLGSHRALLAHIGSAALLFASVYLLVLLATRLLDERTGFITGVIFASVGTVPLLVAWTSGIQDLLAIFFMLLTLLLWLRGNTFVSILAFCAALLSKETAVATLPALLLLRPFNSKARDRIIRALPFVLVVAIWVALHPGLRILASRHFQSGTVGYIGVGNRDVLPAVMRGSLTFLNLPLHSERGLGGRVMVAGVAAAGLFFLLRRPGLIPDPKPSAVVGSPRRSLIASTLLFLGPLCLASTIVTRWEPYYACMPALGGAMTFAILARGVGRRALSVALSAFLAMGILWRGMPLETGVISEPHLHQVNDALRKVEMGFKQIHPNFPRNTTAYVSVGAVGPASVYAHIYRFQALRIWYWDPTLLTLRPESRTPRGHETLFRITPDLRIAEIFPDENRYTSPEGPIPLSEYQRAARAYARGLAASGTISHAANILLRMPTRNPQDANYNRRMAAMLLLNGNNREAAREILDHTPPMSREEALANLGRMLTTTDLKFFDVGYALIAFGLDAGDRAALVGLMTYLYRAGYFDQADVIARRILELSPHDRGALQVREQIASQPKPDITQLSGQ